MHLSDADRSSPVTKGDLEALEETLEEKFDLKLGSLKAWGVAALLGGQTLAAVIGAYIAPRQAGEAVETALRATPFF